MPKLGQISLAAATLVWIACLATVSYAKDPKPKRPPKPLAEAMLEFERALEAKAPKRLAESIRELARSGAAATEKRDKTAVRQKLKRCLAHKTAIVGLAAVRGYGVLAMRRSSRDLRAMIDRRNAKRYSHELVKAALAAWGRIHDPGTHKELLDYIKVPSHKKERRELAKVAASAMAGYKALSGSRRYDMLRDFMQTFNHIYGAGTGMVYPSVAAADWWGAVAPSMVESFNALTALKLGSYKECWTWWKKNHRRVKARKA